MVTRVTVAEVDAAQARADAVSMAPELQAIADAAAAVEGLQTQAEAQRVDVDEGAAVRDEAGQVLELVASIVLPFVAHRWGREVADLYGKQQRQTIADALAAVAEKRGWSVGGVMGKWGPEIALASALVAPVLPRLIEAATADPAPPKPAPAPPPRVEARPVHAADDGRVFADTHGQVPG